MDEAKGTRMQCLTATELEAVLYERLVCRTAVAAQYLAASVSLVGKQRMANVLHVCAYLVCTSCLKYALHEGDIAEALQHTIVCDGTLAYL